MSCYGVVVPLKEHKRLAPYPFLAPCIRSIISQAAASSLECAAVTYAGEPTDFASPFPCLPPPSIYFVLPLPLPPLDELDTFLPSSCLCSSVQGGFLREEGGSLVPSGEKRVPISHPFFTGDDDEEQKPGREAARMTNRL